MVAEKTLRSPPRFQWVGCNVSRPTLFWRAPSAVSRAFVLCHLLYMFHGKSAVGCVPRSHGLFMACNWLRKMAVFGRVGRARSVLCALQNRPFSALYNVRARAVCPALFLHTIPENVQKSLKYPQKLHKTAQKRPKNALFVICTLQKSCFCGFLHQNSHFL